MGLYIGMTNTEGCRTCASVLNGKSPCVFECRCESEAPEIALLNARHVCEGVRVCLLIVRERKGKGEKERGRAKRSAAVFDEGGQGGDTAKSLACLVPAFLFFFFSSSHLFSLVVVSLPFPAASYSFSDLDS